MLVTFMVSVTASVAFANGWTRYSGKRPTENPGAASPGFSLRYTNVGHILLDIIVLSFACGVKRSRGNIQLSFSAIFSIFSVFSNFIGLALEI